MWTRSQDELRGRIQKPCRQGLQTELVRAEYSAGCSRLLRTLAAESALDGGVRVVTASAVYGDWDLLVTLSRLAGTKGASHTDRLLRAMRALSGGGKRPVAVVIEDAHFLTTRQMEAFTLCAENVVEELKAGARLFLIIKRYSHWCQVMSVAKDGSAYWGGAWELREEWPALPKLFGQRLAKGQLNVSELSQDGLELLTRREARAEIELHTEVEQRTALAS